MIERAPRWVAAQDNGAPALVTIPNVELLEVGEDWATSTGTFTWSVDHLQSAIASQDDPMVRTPVIKFGHTDPRFDGQPSVGRVQNMRLTNNDQTLVGDLIGVPAWLAECMASAYPRRSIEGFFDYPTRTGNVWPFALTGVALLGAAYPAIDCLEDVQALFGKEPPVLVEPDEATGVEAAGNAVVAVRLADRHLLRAPQDAPSLEGRTYTDPPTLPVAAADGPQHVSADVSVDDVRMAFYNDPGAEPGRYWWWIREVRVDPAELIVDDDEGHLYRVAYSIGTGDGEDAVEFSDPQQVRIQYVDVAAAGQTIVKRFGNPVAAGRPRVRAANEPTQPTQEETDVQLSEEELRALGLEPGATDEAIHEAIAKLTASPATGETEPPAPETQPPAPETPPVEPVSETPPAPTATIPEGMVLVDEATLTDMREAAAATKKIVEERAVQERNAVLDTAIRAGKFPVSRREHYEKLLLSDPEGGKQMITSLAEGLVPVKERGRQGGETDPEVAASAYPEEWKPQVAAAQRASRGSRIKVASD